MAQRIAMCFRPQGEEDRSSQYSTGARSKVTSTSAVQTEKEWCAACEELTRQLQSKDKEMQDFKKE